MRNLFLAKGSSSQGHRPGFRVQTPVTDIRVLSVSLFPNRIIGDSKSFQLAIARKQTTAMLPNRKKRVLNPLISLKNGGRGGIRTHGTLAGTPVFKTGALNRSATLPSSKSSDLA